jgi:hypothetical protein
MNSLETILDAVEQGPAHVSAALLAFAVSKRIITLEEGEVLAEVALSDPQTICEALCPKLMEAGLVTPEQVVRILGGEPS